jgi:SAM-dependent methyltransferase
MQYVGDLARFQQAASRTEDYAARRAATLRAVAARPGEAVLDVGCGSGLFVRDLAQAVGSLGKAWGIDPSDEQLKVAGSNCAGLSNVEIQVGSVFALPYASGSFDAVTSIQVLEYIDDVPQALAEIHRVLKPSGRFVNFATVWGAIFWHSHAPDRMARMLEAWDRHAPHPNLPARLRALLAGPRFGDVRQTPVAMLNTGYDEKAFSYWLARVIAAIARGRGLVGEDQAALWLGDLASTAERGEYLFCSTAVVTHAAKTPAEPGDLPLD